MTCFVISSPFLYYGTCPALFDNTSLVITGYQRSPVTEQRMTTVHYKETPKETAVATEGLEFLPCPFSGAQTGGISGYHSCSVPADIHLPTALVPLSGRCADLLGQ